MYNNFTDLELSRAYAKTEELETRLLIVFAFGGATIGVWLSVLVAVIAKVAGLNAFAATLIMFAMGVALIYATLYCIRMYQKIL